MFVLAGELAFPSFLYGTFEVVRDMRLRLPSSSFFSSTPASAGGERGQEEGPDADEDTNHHLH